MYHSLLSDSVLHDITTMPCLTLFIG